MACRLAFNGGDALGATIRPFYRIRGLAPEQLPLYLATPWREFEYYCPLRPAPSAPPRGGRRFMPPQSWLSSRRITTRRGDGCATGTNPQAAKTFSRPT
jgi:hypothetical protein